MSRDRKRYYDDGGDRNRDRKRRRTDEGVLIEDRLESLISRVGEKSSSSLESNLEGLASVLEADLPNYKDRILKIICTCASNLPEKITVYSTLVGLLNAKNYSCGEEFLDMIMVNLQDILNSAQFERARMMVRFISDMVNCQVLLPSALLELLEKFMAATMDGNIPQVRSDWFAYTVMSALPWCGKTLADKKPSEFERLLATIENYMSQRKKPHLAALRVWSTDDPHPQEEYLDCLWAQLTKMKTDNWQEKHIRRPYFAFASTLGDALQHTLQSLTIPAHKEDTVYPIPMVVYRMFDYTDVPEGPVMPGAHSIERFLVEEGIRRVIDSNYKDKKECASQLLNLPGKAKVPFSYCLVEVIFSELFRLPVPNHVPLLYGSLFIELCKIQPGTMPGVLAQATELLFERLETMNTSCVDRFINWFCYHLSNFQFKWSWDEWLTVVESPDSVKYRFVCEVFDKIRRLSYHQYLVDNLPEGFQPLIPSQSQPCYKFAEGNEHLAGAEVASQLIEAIRAKKDIEDLQTILNDIPANDSDGEQSFPVVRLEVLFQVLLKLGSKSFSHSFSALAKFHKLLKSVVVNEEAQIHCLETIKDFWKLHPQMLVVLVDKLIRMQIVECSAVVNWLLSRQMAPELMRFYVWEIMTGTLKKMSKHTKKVSDELKEVKDKLTKLEEKVKKQKELSESSESDAKEPVSAAAKDAEEIERRQGQVEQLTEKVENSEREQKQLFLIVFQRFIMMLTEHVVQCEQQQNDVTTPWFKYTADRLKEVLLTNHNQVSQYLSTLETLLFTSDLDTHILGIFDQFKSLKA